MLTKIEIEKYYGRNSYHPPKWLLRWRAHLYLRQILKQIKIKPCDNILEIGCNCGYLTDLLRELSPSVIGIDINASLIKRACKNYLQVMDACNLLFPNCHFDLIVSTHTIEHIPDLFRFFGEMERVLKKGGYLVLVYPWEPIRGYTVVPEILLSNRSLKERYKIHLHSLTPRKIESLITSLPFRHVTWRVFFVPQPNFISVIQKFWGSKDLTHKIEEEKNDTPCQQNHAHRLGRSDN